MNGRLVTESEATVPFLTAGLHYGMAVFEGIRCYDTPFGPAVFRLRDHLERLAASARILGFPPLDYGTADLIAAVKQTIAANEFRACYIRPLVYLSDGGMNLSLLSARVSVGIAVWPWEAFHSVDVASEGIRLGVSSYTRHHPNVMPTKAKVAGNYVNSFLAKTESVRCGFDDAILLDPQGYVAECSGQNLFLVRRGRLLTPPLSAVLEGITRETVITLADNVGCQVAEEVIPRDWLYDADEVFVCGTASEIVPVREVDFQQVRRGAPGPITQRLREEYYVAVMGQHERSAEWLDYLEYTLTPESSAFTGPSSNNDPRQENGG